MSGNLFEEYVNSIPLIDFLTDNELDEIVSSSKFDVPGHGTSHDTWGDFWAGVDPDIIDGAARGHFRPIPIWTRVCASCGIWFFSTNWRAEHCPECGGGE